MQRPRRRRPQDLVATRSDGGGSAGPGRERPDPGAGARRRSARAGYVTLIVGLALTLAMVLVAPAAPASAYVNPQGRFQLRVIARNQCLTVPFNGVPGTFVIRAPCTGAANQTWHFDRIGGNDTEPIFEIRATHRVDDYGNYSDCLDLPYGDARAGRPIWTWPCNGGLAQQWRRYTEFTPNQGWIHLYSSEADPGRWVMQFNNGDAYPHLVMVPRTPLGGSWYQRFWTAWVAS